MLSRGLVEMLRGEGWLTVTEAAHLFGVSHNTIYRRVEAGLLPSKRVGAFGEPKPGSRKGLGTLFVSRAAMEQTRESK